MNATELTLTLQQQRGMMRLVSELEICHMSQGLAHCITAVIEPDFLIVSNAGKENYVGALVCVSADYFCDGKEKAISAFAASLLNTQDVIEISSDQ